MWSVTSWLTLDLLDVISNKSYRIKETWNWIEINIQGFNTEYLLK